MSKTQGELKKTAGRAPTLVQGLWFEAVVAGAAISALEVVRQSARFRLRRSRSCGSLTRHSPGTSQRAMRRRVGLESAPPKADLRRAFAKRGARGARHARHRMTPGIPSCLFSE